MDTIEKTKRVEEKGSVTIKKIVEKSEKLEEEVKSPEVPEILL